MEVGSGAQAEQEAHRVLLWISACPILECAARTSMRGDHSYPWRPPEAWLSEGAGPQGEGTPGTETIP